EFVCSIALLRIACVLSALTGRRLIAGLHHFWWMVLRLVHFEHGLMLIVFLLFVLFLVHGHLDDHRLFDFDWHVMLHGKWLFDHHSVGHRNRIRNLFFAINRDFHGIWHRVRNLLIHKIIRCFNTVILLIYLYRVWLFHFVRNRYFD